MVVGTRKIPTQSQLIEALQYDPETGALTWKHRPASHFVSNGYCSQRKANAWNARFAGKMAFCTIHNSGYFAGGLFGQRLLAHRVIFKMIHNIDPIEVDHINGIRTDNRIENLRSVTTVENSRNRGMHPRNTSGINGVFWDKKEAKWAAMFKTNGSQRRLGSFDSIDQAIAARAAAEKDVGTTRNMDAGHRTLDCRKGKANDR